MASMTEPIIVQIVNEVTGGGKGGGAPGAKGKGAGAKDGSLGALAGGLTKMLGMGAIIVEILKLVGDALESVIKPIKMMLGGIFKMIVQLLRPISDVIVLLLMPFLAFLKPIIKVFNDIMRPYRTLAYRLMKESTTTTSPIQKGLLSTLAISTIFAGFAMALVGVLKEILKTQVIVIAELLKNFLINPLINMLWPLISMFTSKSLEEYKKGINQSIDDSVAFINDGLDTLFNSLNSTVLEALKTTAETLGVDVKGIDTTTFRGSVTGLIKSAIEQAAVDAARSSRGVSDSSGRQVITVTSQQIQAKYGASLAALSSYATAGDVFAAVKGGTLNIKTNAKVT